MRIKWRQKHEGDSALSAPIFDILEVTLWRRSRNGAALRALCLPGFMLVFDWNLDFMLMEHNRLAFSATNLPSGLPEGSILLESSSETNILCRISGELRKARSQAIGVLQS